MCVGLVQNGHHYYLFELNIGLLYVSVASITVNRNTLYYLFQFNFLNVIDTAPNKVMRDFTNNSLQCPIEIIISTKHVAIEG